MFVLPTVGAWYVTLFTVLFVLVCVFMMLVILIQKPRGGGLSGAFGGAGGSATSVFGAKTGDVLTWFTVVCFVLFIGLAMLLTWTAKPGAVPKTPVLNSPPVTGLPDDLGGGTPDGGTDKGGGTKDTSGGDSAGENE